MKNMTKEQKVSVLWYLTAFCDYLCAMVNFFTNNHSTGTIWLCLGSAAMCLGALFLSKHKRNNDNVKDKADKSNDTDKTK